MLEDAKVLANVDAAFAACAKPEHFTNYTHCEECREHDNTIRSRDRDSLSVDDVGHPSWNPLCFISAEGFCYFLPTLARLAIKEPPPDTAYYFPQLLFHLTHRYERNRHFAHCTADQREAVVKFLRHLAQSRAALVDKHFCTKELELAVRIWSRVSA